MKHPFALNNAELASAKDSVRELNAEDINAVSGACGPIYTTMALGEEGGDYTTMAVGEEGGDTPTTMAIGEEGGDYTTMAIGEEGGDWDF